jgi:hypothetical protein
VAQSSRHRPDAGPTHSRSCRKASAASSASPDAGPRAKSSASNVRGA